jgi:hypothetical protein
VPEAAGVTGRTARGFRLVCLLLACAPAWAQQALVRSYDNPASEVGQAYLAHYGERCLAILPTHVAAEAGDPAGFLREGSGGLLGESEAYRDLGDDVSVADVSGAIRSACGYSTLAISRAVDSRIRASGLASLRSVNADGSIAHLAVTIIDDDGQRLLRVQPTNDANQISKGQSGSLLMAGDTPIGMLLSVDGRFGVGKVLRLDALLDKVDSLVAIGPRAGDADQDSARPDPAGAVTGWSALPIDAAHRAANLLATDDAPAWMAAVDGWPIAVELDLPGERMIIAGVELDGKGIDDTGLLPATVEVMVSGTEAGRRWRSVWGGAITFDDGIATFRFAPSWARHLKLVISATAGGDRTVALRRVRAIPAD